MAKLNTTVSNIELQSNKIVAGSIPEASWTDAQYPSAKTLYNAYTSLLTLIQTNNSLEAKHPIGDIVITPTNVDPSETLGGTWALIDKTFKENLELVTDISDLWESNSDALTLQPSSSLNQTAILNTGHTLYVRLNLKLLSDITSGEAGTTIGTLNLDKCGVSQLAFSVTNAVAVSDGGNCTVCYNILTDGRIQIADILNIDDTHSIKVSSSGTVIILNLSLPVKPEHMLDDFCDKFYWQRTA
jgi:hypothetical protein